MNQENSSIEHSIPIKKLLAIYFKISKKRIVSIIVIGSIFFLIFSSITIISFDLYQDRFYSYIEKNHDWLHDDEISIANQGTLIDSEVLVSNY
ncbi:MAG: hypothetical protein FK734_10210 [Asgard group archaeon]|nr:hypothetical protein [Asgard group archaeon]